MEKVGDRVEDNNFYKGVGGWDCLWFPHHLALHILTLDYSGKCLDMAIMTGI